MERVSTSWDKESDSELVAPTSGTGAGGLTKTSRKQKVEENEEAQQAECLSTKI